MNTMLYQVMFTLEASLPLLVMISYSHQLHTRIHLSSSNFFYETNGAIVIALQDESIHGI